MARDVRTQLHTVSTPTHTHAHILLKSVKWIKRDRSIYSLVCTICFSKSTMKEQDRQQTVHMSHIHTPTLTTSLWDYYYMAALRISITE